ncbi:MAG: heparinase II/III family protein, partial [Oscillospiraceae bacterium]|nr:heparinase II/III family protein [Oscillospiraceae bacterium]
VNFSDGNSFMGNAALDYPLYAYGKRTGEESLCRLAGTLKRERQKLYPDTPSAVRGGSLFALLSMLIDADEIDAQPEFVPEEICILPDLQNTFIREGKWYYAAKGGHNDEQHNHNDVGNLIVRHGTQPVLIDAGCGTYTRFTFSPERYTIWTMQSGWHNLPVVNGFEQPAGKKFCADRFTLTDKTTDISFSGAYPAEAGLQKLSRRIGIDEEGVSITDSFVFPDGENAAEEHFISLLEPQKTDDGILLGGKYLLSATIPCEVFIDRMNFPDDAKLSAAWGTDHLWRTRMSFVCGEKCHFSVRITEI